MSTMWFFCSSYTNNTKERIKSNTQNECSKFQDNVSHKFVVFSFFANFWPELHLLIASNVFFSINNLLNCANPLPDIFLLFCNFDAVMFPFTCYKKVCCVNCASARCSSVVHPIKNRQGLDLMQCVPVCFIQNNREGKES